MKDPGDLIEFLQEETGYVFVLPTKGQRPEFPYVNIVPIDSQQDDIYQAVSEKGPSDMGDKSFQETIRWPRRSQFSITAIDDPTDGIAEQVAQAVFNKLKQQVTFDWLKGRRESLQIVGQPRARFLIEDDWNEARWGFDILYSDTVAVSQDKEFIDELTVEDTSGKVSDIIIEDQQES